MDSYWLEYRIIQMVRGGTLLQLQRLVEICGKTFMVVSFVQYLIDWLYENFTGKLPG